jgi:hypothetical protein
VANAACKAMGFAFKEKNPELFVSDAVLGRLGLKLPDLTSLLSGIESDVRAQITETFTAIFK